MRGKNPKMKTSIQNGAKRRWPLCFMYIHSVHTGSTECFQKGCVTERWEVFHDLFAFIES